MIVARHREPPLAACELSRWGGGWIPEKRCAPDVPQPWRRSERTQRHQNDGDVSEFVSHKDNCNVVLGWMPIE